MMFIELPVLVTVYMTPFLSVLYWLRDILGSKHCVEVVRVPTQKQQR